MEAIVLLSGNSLSRNPRVVKEASSLAAAGIEVEVLGGWVDDDTAEEDVAIARSGSFSFVPLMRPTLRARVERRVARALMTSIATELPSTLGYGVRALLSVARRKRASLFIAHSEPGLWVAAQLAREGRVVGLDMEDWYSEDLPPEARSGRPVRLLRSLEEELLRNASHRSCTSRAMSEALAERHRCPAPAVIYNAFPWQDRQAIDGLRRDRSSSAVPTLHWYSQTIGPGRGLEDLLAALPLLRGPCELHLRGAISAEFKARIMEGIPEGWRHRIHFQAPVPNRELLSRIAEHDIGLALEKRSPPSRDLTVTNKVLHYLLGGLPVVASDTSGQREVADQAPGAVHLYSAGDPNSLAKAANELLESIALRQRAREAALDAARRIFSWEVQAPALIRSVSAAMKA